MASVDREPGWSRPTRVSAVLYAAKVAAFRVRRGAVDAALPPLRFSKAGSDRLIYLTGLSATPLWSDPTLAEQAMQAGKNQNLAVAACALDGLVLPAGQVFSFWRHVGPPTAGRGYVAGRMLQEGCMVSAIGGGLCQLSNALYEVALQAGCLIVERHPHSRIVPGSAAAAGRDATVAWNYVDLRFTPREDLRLSVELDGADLVVRLLSATEAPGRPVGPVPLDTPVMHPARSCASCDETACFRHEGRH
jgi:hypothetical protein